MNKKTLIIISIICIVSCTKNPCNELVDGVYQFPELPENHGMTSEEVTQYWDLPEEIGECISTEGLLETCLNYPELRLIMAGVNPQWGYDRLVKERFLGMRLLEIRPDNATCLLNKYKTIDPLGFDPNWELRDIGHYILNIYYFEIIFSQPSNLEKLTDSEIIELFDKALFIYEEKKSDLTNYGVFSLASTTNLLGRLMLEEEYEPFINVYERNSLVKELTEYYWPTNIETTEIVITISKNFLKQLKNL